jgi:hypothetical protein
VLDPVEIQFEDLVIDGGEKEFPRSRQLGQQLEGIVLWL